MDISTAHVIEAYRLSTALASLRGVKPRLEELNDAVISVMCMGDATLMRLIEEKLIVGEKMGKIPPGAARPPLQRDFGAKIKSYRLQKREDEKLYTLDLRKEAHLEKSVFLHRLKVLQIDWGRSVETRSRGNFNEIWALLWQPTIDLEIIDKGIWGNSVESAAKNYLTHQANTTTSAVEVSALISDALIAKLFESVAFMITRIDDLISQSSDVTHLIETVLPLITLSRYDDMRKTDKSVLDSLIEALITKITIHLRNACYALDNDTAKEMFDLLRALGASLTLYKEGKFLGVWLDALFDMLEDDLLPHTIQGFSCRALFDSRRIDEEKLRTLFARALSFG